MPQFFFNKRLIVLLVSIIILVALIGFSLNGRKTITWPEQFVKDTVGLVQSTAHKPAQYVALEASKISKIHMRKTKY